MGKGQQKRSRRGRAPPCKRRAAARERHKRAQHASHNNDEAGEARKSGGFVKTFNPSALNDRDIGDEEVTSIDTSICVQSEDGLSSGGDTVVGVCRDVAMFLPASQRTTHGRPVPDSSSCLPERSLSDLYDDYPDLKLSNLDQETVELAGATVKQLIFEATHKFLERVIPEGERQKIWSQILNKSRKGGNDSKIGKTITRIVISPNELRLHSLRPLSYLIDIYRSILTTSFSTPDFKATMAVFNRGIALCDALADHKRAEALHKARQNLSWLVLGLDCKNKDAYQQLNQELKRIDRDLPLKWITHGETQRVEISPGRRHAEREILLVCKRSYDGLKEPFRVGFAQALQDLMGPVG